MMCQFASLFVLPIEVEHYPQCHCDAYGYQYVHQGVVVEVQGGNVQLLDDEALDIVLRGLGRFCVAHACLKEE